MTGVSLEPLLVPSKMPLADKGQEAWGRDFGLLCPYSAQSHEQGWGGGLKKGAVGGVGSYEGVLVVNGPGVAPFLSITP